MMFAQNTSPSYDHIWQVRLLVLTLLVSLLLSSLWGFLTVLLMFRVFGFWGWPGLVLALSGIVTDLFLLVQLKRKHENVFLWVTVRAVSFVLLWGAIVINVYDDLSGALAWLFLSSGVSLPMLMLAAGKPGRWRKILAALSLVGYSLISGFSVIMIIALIFLNPD